MNFNYYNYEELFDLGYEIGLFYIELRNEYSVYKYDLLLTAILCCYNIII